MDMNVRPDRIDQAPAFRQRQVDPVELRRQLEEAIQAWLTRSPSAETRDGYSRDLYQFLDFVRVPNGEWETLAQVRPRIVSAWRDHLPERGPSNMAVSRKLSVLRSLYGYLRKYGYTGANPADTAFVAAPAVPRDGKTVALSPEDCRKLVDFPPADTPEGVRDRAILAVLAFTGCRVGEVSRLRVGDYKRSGGHHVLEERGKAARSGQCRCTPEAVERLEAWLAVVGDDATDGPLFRPLRTARGQGKDGFRTSPLNRRGLQYLVRRYVLRLGLDPNVSVYSFRVTALTTARERGADIVDLQDFAGHADPRTTPPASATATGSAAARRMS